MAGHRSLCLRVPGKPCWRSQRSQTFIPLALAYPLGCSSNADTPTMPAFTDGGPADVFFPAQVASKQRPTLLSTQIKWTALPCQGQTVFANMPVCSIKPHAKGLAQVVGTGNNVSILSFTQNKCGSQAGHQNQVLFRRPIRSESESWGRSPSTTPTCSTMFPWGACR